MKNLKKVLATLLVVSMALSMLPGSFAAERPRDAWTDDIFVDVSAADWFYPHVKNAYQVGLMHGYGNGTFQPYGDITLAESITIAANIRAIREGEQDSFRASTPWYQTYVDYASAHGIPTGQPEDYNRAVTRLEFVRVMAKALPERQLEPVCAVPDGSIPDVAEDEDVYLLYRAGVLSGTDEKGTFLPGKTIDRCEVAVIVGNLARLATDEDDKGGSGGAGSSGGASRPAAPQPEPDTQEPDAPGPDAEPVDENNAPSVPFDLAYPDLFASGEVAYSGEQILIKLAGEPSSAQQAQLNGAGVTGLEFVMKTADAVWYKAYVSGEVTQAMAAVRKLDFVLLAEYDFAYETQTIIECTPEELPDAIKGNDRFDEQWYLRACGLQDGWNHLKNPHKRPHYDEEAGESGTEKGEDVVGVEAGEGIVIAVIDTGVDYTHEDLKDNIWVNTGEIPNDGIDNDKNDYIDDYYGYDAVAGKGSAMDDQGHGTHVAGIIAAANNNMGTVGIAYNAKIMPIKAGMASGYFNQSDIVEAIVYACKNGADVINMSFGGNASSVLVQEALEDAYTHCVLVAAAGNDGAPNQKSDFHLPMPTYPAALPYVLGVMSVDSSGKESSFTNWDAAAYNGVEYELYAPGDQMISTIPGNRYATWSGTSMAAPVVSGMAALLRSEFRDRGTYPTKFIYGQLCSTSSITATCLDPKDHAVGGGAHSLPQIVDVYSALTKMPTPEVSLSDYALFDTAGLNDNERNNGDGVIDAGETIALGFEVRNRWGKSSDTVITVDALTQNGTADPYITIHNSSVNIGSVGTYSTNDCGKVVEDDLFVAWENPVYITVSPDCPNDYLFNLNVKVACGNGLNSEDTTTYTSSGKVTFNVRRGVILPSVIEEDMTLTADNYYIIPNATLISADACVTVEPGTQIQFWSDDANDPYADSYMAYLKVDGKLICNGTAEKPIKMFPGERMSAYRVEIQGYRTELYYTDIVNPYINVAYAEGCTFSQNYLNSNLDYRYLSYGSVRDSSAAGRVYVNQSVNCAYYRLGRAFDFNGDFDGCAFIDCAARFIQESYSGITYENCLFYGNNNYLGNNSGSISSLYINFSSEFSGDFFTDPDTGISYLVSKDNNRAYDLLAEELGGGLACVNSPEELEFLKKVIPNYSYYLEVGLEYDRATGEVRWADGSEVGDFIQYTVGNSFWNDSYMTTKWAFAIANDTHGAGYSLYEFPPRYVGEITLDSYAVDLDTESSGWQIHATPGPIGIADAKLIYRSMDESVATVSDTGLITPVAVGETEIRVYAPDLAIYSAVSVTVHERVALESVNLGEDFRLALDENRQILPVRVPENTTQQRLVYASNNERVAIVSDAGLVTAVGVGSAVITATNPDSGISASVRVEGYIPVTSVEAEEPFVVLGLDQRDTVEDLKVSVYPANATYPDLIWESSNPEVLEVGEDGRLVKGQAGAATLRATAEGTELYAEIMVCIAQTDPDVTVVQMGTFGTNGNSYGGPYTVALLSDGTLWRWGDDVLWPEQMGYYEGVAYQNPGTFVPFTNIRQFAVKNDYFPKLFALDKNGVLNVYEVDSAIYISPAKWQKDNQMIGGAALGNVVDVTSGGSAFYLCDDGTVWGAGSNNYGQLGVGNTTDYSSFVQMQGLDGIKIVDVEVEKYKTYLLADNDDLYCCGDNIGTLPQLMAEDVKSIHGSEGEGRGVIIEFADRVQIGLDAKKSEAKKEEAVCYTSSYYSTSMSPYSLLYLAEDGSVWGKLSSTDTYGNEYGQLGVGHDGKVTAYTRMEKIDNATNIFCLDKTTYVQTADGKLYGTGNNYDGQINPLLAAEVHVPQQVYFGLTSQPAPVLEGSNLVLDESGSRVLQAPTLMLDFDQGLIAGDGYPTITLKDSSGQSLGLSRRIYLDRFLVTPASGFTVGETYTLTVPADAFCNYFSAGTAALSYTFTVGQKTQEAYALLDLEGSYTVEDVAADLCGRFHKIRWESSDEEILEIKADGSLLLHKAGLVTLRGTPFARELFEEVTVYVSDTAPEVDVVQMGRYTYSENVYTMALLADGTMWHWGGGMNFPEQMTYKYINPAGSYSKQSFAQVEEFALYSCGGCVYLLTLDRSGVLKAYDLSDITAHAWYENTAVLDGASISGVTAIGADEIASSEVESAAYWAMEDGSVWAVGSNSHGQLGNESTDEPETAVEMVGLDDVTIVDMVYSTISKRAYLLADDGTLYFCGGNNKVTAPEVYAEGVVSIRPAAGSALSAYGVFVEYADEVGHDLAIATEAKAEGAKGYEFSQGHNGATTWYIAEDGCVWGKGNNVHGQLGTGDTLASADYVCMEQMEGAEKLFAIYDTLYVQTADGKLYGIGGNEAGEINGLFSATRLSPLEVLFGFVPEYDRPVADSNLIELGEDKYALNDPQLTLKFDQALVAGSKFGSISLTDREGMQVDAEVALNLDTLTITPKDGFRIGETYTVTTSVWSVHNHFKVNAAAIRYTFTVGGDQMAAEGTTVPNPDFEGERDYLDLEELQSDFEAQNINPVFFHNAIVNRLELQDVTTWLRVQGRSMSSYTKYPLGQNYWGTTNETLIGHQILDFEDFQTLAYLDKSNYLTAAPETVWPFAVNAGLLNADGKEVDLIGNETVTFFVEFNRDMDTDIPLDVRFGSAYPYGDYELEGEWVSARRWEGTTTLTTLVEAGYQFWSISNGRAADNPALKLFDDWGRFRFEIDTSEALAMTLQGEAGDEGITLTWSQDDFDTLMGYNVYRADRDEDGYYQKLNTSIIPQGTETFFDDTVEPGQVYYYLFTVVKTDFTESEPSGKIRLLSKDTMSPVLYHTPVYSAYEGNNVVISATATDNLQLASVKLIYRVTGSGEWKEAAMTKLNDKYSAVISGDKVTTAGIEYYVSASDGVNVVYRGSAEEPYVIVVQENPGQQMLGDVNGDGRITIADALRLLRAINNKVVLTEEEFKRADLDSSGVLTAAEALTILKYSNGEIGSLQMN